MSENEKTHFGYQSVPADEKVQKVGEVFDSVASQYDLMNDMMSFGIHRLWKRFAIAKAGVRAGHRVLDVAAGTGDLSLGFVKQIGEKGELVVSDINVSMLNIGRDRLLDSGAGSNVRYIQADAEQLPFPENYFDCITIAFGLRNVTRKENALKSMLRVLKPGGKLLVLEFSKPVLPLLEKIYDTYSFSILPKLGEWVVGDADSYQYLAESIRMHPDQETLKQMMLDAGFENCDYNNLTGGVVALHRGYKF